MRQVTFTIEPTDGYFHPVDRLLVEDPDVTPEAIYHAVLLEDDTLRMFASARGDGDRYRELMAGSEWVREVTVTSADGRHYGHSRIETNRLIRRLIALDRQKPYAIEYPVEVTPAGGHRYRAVGGEETFAGGNFELPDGVELEIESITSYEPTGRGIFGSLTRREREVLTVALDAGYYENPRQATQADLAAELDVAPGTVGEHLRTIESKVLSGFR